MRLGASRDASIAAREWTIADAVARNRGLKFDYKNLGASKALKRHVHPYHLACIDNHWYLFAYDLRRKAMRTFALARLRDPEATGTRFAPPPEFDLDEYLRGSFTVLKGSDDFEVTIQFDPWATDLLRSRQWHSSQRFVELPGIGSQLQMRLNSLDEVQSWLLSWGHHATVLRPKTLLSRLKQTLLVLTERYSDDSNSGAGSIAA